MTADSTRASSTNIPFHPPAALEQLQTLMPPPNGGLGHPRTKVDWREYISHQRAPQPELPKTLREYRRLASSVREELDDARIAHLSGLILESLPVNARIHTHVRRTMRLNQHVTEGTRTGVLIDGESGLGKTTLAKLFGRRYELDLRAKEPWTFGQPYVDRIPVIYLSMPDSANPHLILLALADYLGIPNRGKSSDWHKLKEVVISTMKICQTRLVIVDEMHFVRQTEKNGRAVHDFLKNLAGALPATFVCVGTNMTETPFFSEGTSGYSTQTSVRFTRLLMEPYGQSIRNGSRSTRVLAREAKEWQDDLVGGFENNLQLYKHDPGSLVRDLSGYLFDRSRGRIGILADLVRGAALAAIEEGYEKVDHKLLDDFEVAWFSTLDSPNDSAIIARRSH